MLRDDLGHRPLRHPELQATALSSTPDTSFLDRYSPNESIFIIERRIDGGSFAWRRKYPRTPAVYQHGSLTRNRILLQNQGPHLSGDSAIFRNRVGDDVSTVIAQIIADHTVVDRYNAIPQYYIDQVKEMLSTWPGIPSSGIASGRITGAP